MEVSVDVTRAGDSVGPAGSPVGGVDAGVDGAFACVEANVGPGVGVSGVCVETGVGGSGVGDWVVAVSGAGELAGNGVVAALRPGVAVGTACGVSVGCGACAAVSSPVEVVVTAATGAVLVANRLGCPREKPGLLTLLPVSCQLLSEL